MDPLVGIAHCHDIRCGELPQRNDVDIGQCRSTLCWPDGLNPPGDPGRQIVHRLGRSQEERFASAEASFSEPIQFERDQVRR